MELDTFIKPFLPVYQILIICVSTAIKFRKYDQNFCQMKSFCQHLLLITSRNCISSPQDTLKTIKESFLLLITNKLLVSVLEKSVETYITPTWTLCTSHRKQLESTTAAAVGRRSDL